jgi:hypothetical protein
MLGHIRNTNLTPVYFNMPSDIPMEGKSVVTVLIRGLDNEKTIITEMLSVLTDEHKQLPYVISWRKIMPKQEAARKKFG